MRTASTEIQDLLLDLLVDYAKAAQELQAGQSEASKCVTTNHKSWTALAQCTSNSRTYWHNALARAMRTAPIGPGPTGGVCM